MRVSGIGGLSHGSPTQYISNFRILAVKSARRKIDITAVIVPKVTCDLPVHPVPSDSKWKHLTSLSLADPTFGKPGRIDILLGIDVFADVLRQGRRTGPAGSPVAFATEFGWVLSGQVEPSSSAEHVTTHHTSVVFKDDTLHKSWEIEEAPTSEVTLSLEERGILNHFKTNHSRTEGGRFVVPLPKRPDAKSIGESRSQAVRTFLSLERSLNSRGGFQEFESVMREYMDLGHAELIPSKDMEKPESQVFYLPMHAVYKSSSSTTKIGAVFDASAKSASGVSLSDILLIGPTVHPPAYRYPLMLSASSDCCHSRHQQMNRAVELSPSDRDLHCFVWRSRC